MLGSMPETKVTPGSPAWALAQLRAGRAVRKVDWNTGPHYILGEDGALLAVGVQGYDNIPRDAERIILGDPIQRWELHPPRPVVSTMAPTVAWILMLFPRYGGVDALAVAAETMRTGDDADFAQALLVLWERAGQAETGRRIVEALASIDRGVFRRSFTGDAGASALILNTITTIVSGRALPRQE